MHWSDRGPRVRVLDLEAFRPGASHGRDRALFFNHTLAALAMQHPVCEGSRGQHGIDTWA